MLNILDLQRYCAKISKKSGDFFCKKFGYKPKTG